MADLHSRDENHFHIRWHRKEELDWECFDTGEQAMARALELASRGEIFSIEEVHLACALRGVPETR